MKVYIVIEHMRIEDEFDSSDIIGVFDSEEKAEKFEANRESPSFNHDDYAITTECFKIND